MWQVDFTDGQEISVTKKKKKNNNKFKNFLSFRMEKESQLVIKLNKTNPLVEFESVRKVKILNNGTYGEVWLLIDEQSRKEYALKVFRENCEPEKIEKEVDLNKKLSSLKNSKEYFVQCYGEIIFAEYEEGQEESEQKLGLLFEKADGTLTKYLAKRPVLLFEEFLHIFQCINDGLLILQQNFQCSHLDIKPGNIVFQKPSNPEDFPKFKLIDYGETLFIKSINTLAKGISVVGTPHYFSPEINHAFFNGTDTNAINTYKSDAYSLGLVLIETFGHKKIKFPKNSIGERFDEKTTDPMKIEIGPYDYILRDLIEEMREKYKENEFINDLIELIGDMVNYNYNKRPSFVEIALRIRKVCEKEQKKLRLKIRSFEKMKEGGENLMELKEEVERLYDEKREWAKNSEELKEEIFEKEEKEKKIRKKYEKIKLENQILLEKIRQGKKKDSKEEEEEETKEDKFLKLGF